MKTAYLLTIAISTFACTHSQNIDVSIAKDSLQHACIQQNATVTPVVKSKPIVHIAPDMPFFKDVLDSKRLFW